MKIDISGTGIQIDEQLDLLEDARSLYKKFLREVTPYTDWVKWPVNIDSSLIDDIKSVAEAIKEKCDLLIVIGIGGSYLGAKAIIDGLNGSCNNCPEITFAGYNMSGAYLNKVITQMKKEAVCVCVISKSGTTVEPLLSYSIIKEKLIEKYGYEEAKSRIYVITDKSEGALRKEVQLNGYKSFEVPSGIGGRFSVLTPVGLLPIAVAGHDIEKLLLGAAEMAISKDWDENLLKYVICRVALQNNGKSVEVFEFFETNLHYFGEWLKQLFCESEGKEGKGAFATSLCFSRDLHSVGQFLQQGSQMFYETMIRIGHAEYDFEIPDSAGSLYAGKTLEQINECAEDAVVIAHKKEGIPIMTIEIPMLDEYNLGKLIYFFEMSCAISASLIGVNPFDQPGVEAYKTAMLNLVREL